MSGLASWLAALQLAGCLVIAAASLLVRCSRGRSAATRRSIWALAVTLLLVLPFARLGLGVPSVELGLLAPTFVGLWAIGVLALGSRQVWAGAATRRELGRSTPLEDKRWQRSLAEFDLRSRPALRVHPELATPCVIGCLRATIVIPRHVLELDGQARRSVLAHELAHIARADNLLLHAAVWARALYWICPPAWWCLHQLRAELEAAADDAVLEAGVSSTTYASALLALARAQLAVGRQLRPRIEAILDHTRRRVGIRNLHRPSRAYATLLVVAITLASLATACEGG